MARTRDVLDDLAEWYGEPAGPAAAAGGATASRAPFGALREVGLGWARLGMVRILQVLVTRYDRARQRRSLLELSDHMLRDIGVSRAEALGEAAKPFWRT